MCADEVARSEGTKKGQLPSHDGCSDDTSKALGIHTGHRRVGAFDTEHLQHRPLGSKDGTTSDTTDFNARHGNGHQEVLAIIGPV